MKMLPHCMVRLFQIIRIIPSLLTLACYSKQPTYLTVSDKGEIAETLINFHCIMKVKAGMDQFLSSLNAVGLLNYLYSRPEVMKPLITHTQITLTSG